MAADYLITGAGGRLGRAFSEVLGRRAVSLKHGELDISDADAVRRALEGIKPKLVINAAAWTDVSGAETHRRDAYRINAHGVGILAREAAVRDVALLHFSTDYVFSGEGGEPWRESDRPDPAGIYGMSKLEGENYFFRSGVRGAVVRVGWLHSGERDFVEAILSRAMSGADLTVVDNQVGTPSSAAALARWAVRALPALTASRHALLRHYREAGGYISRYDFAAYILTRAQALLSARGMHDEASAMSIARANMGHAKLAPGIRPLNCRLGVGDTAPFSEPENWKKAVDKSVENVKGLFSGLWISHFDRR